MQKFFDLFQIACLALFLALFIGKTIYLKRKEKINAIKLSFSKDGSGYIIEIILFILVNLWTFSLLAYCLNSAFGILKGLPKIILFDFTALKIIGLVLEVFGFFFFIFSLLHLGNSWRLGIDEKNPGSLVTNGIYTFSRHPIYVFFNLYFFGTFLINGNLIFAVFTILLALVLHLQILQEERFLVKTYGKVYSDYMQDINRYFNFKLLAKPSKIKYLFRFERSE